MLIQEIPISKINLAPYNPRKDLKPTDPEYIDIKSSIDEFDLMEPLIVNDVNNILISGHQRLKVLKDRGDTKVTAVLIHEPDKKREMARVIRMNKSHGTWDIPKLKDLLIELDDGEFDLPLTGYNEIELENLITWEKVKEDEDKSGSTELDQAAFNNLPIQCPKCGFEFEKSVAKPKETVEV